MFSWKGSDLYQFCLLLLLLLLFIFFFSFPKFCSLFFLQILNRLSLLARESHSLLKRQIETCALQSTDFKVGNAWYPMVPVNFCWDETELCGLIFRTAASSKAYASDESWLYSQAMSLRHLNLNYNHWTTDVVILLSYCCAHILANLPSSIGSLWRHCSPPQPPPSPWKPGARSLETGDRTSLVIASLSFTSGRELRPCSVVR